MSIFIVQLECSNVSETGALCKLAARFCYARHNSIVQCHHSYSQCTYVCLRAWDKGALCPQCLLWRDQIKVQAINPWSFKNIHQNFKGDEEQWGFECWKSYKIRKCAEHDAKQHHLVKISQPFKEIRLCGELKWSRKCNTADFAHAQQKFASKWEQSA